MMTFYKLKFKKFKIKDFNTKKLQHFTAHQTNTSAKDPHSQRRQGSPTHPVKRTDQTVHF